MLMPTYDCNSGAITFITTGGDGSRIQYRANGITGWTTNPNQFVDRETRTAADAPVILLQARQNGEIVTLDFNIRAVCPVGSRTGVDFAESDAPLGVRALGNPTQSETITVDVRGAEGQSLRLTVRDMQGRTVSGEVVKQAEAVERHTLSLGRTPGVYLLQISTPTRSRTLKVLRQ